MKKAISAKGETDGKRFVAKDVDEYLATIPEEARAALEKLRGTIRSAAPKATETISYQIPTFVHNGALVAFGAFKNHLSFFPMSIALMEAHREELAPWSTSRGTIRFSVDKPLPATLVKKLVKARIKENDEKKKKDAVVDKNVHRNRRKSD